MFGLFALTYNRLGDTALALDYLRKSISLDRELPAHKQDLNNVAGGLLFLAGLLRAQGDHKGALEATRDGLDIRRALATKDPNNPGVRSELSFGLYQFGDVLRASGDLAGALDAYSEGLEIARELVAQDTTNSARNCLLGIVLDRKGVVQLARSNLPEALVAFRETLDIARQLTATDPQNMEWRHDLTASLEYVGDVLSAQGDVGGAMAAYREGLDNRRKLVTQDPSNVYWQTGVVLLLVRLAEYGDDPRSRWSEALSILAPLRAKNWLKPVQQEWIADIEGKLAKLDQKQNHFVSPTVEQIYGTYVGTNTQSQIGVTAGQGPERDEILLTLQQSGSGVTGTYQTSRGGRGKGAGTIKGNVVRRLKRACCDRRHAKRDTKNGPRRRRAGMTLSFPDPAYGD